MDSSAVPRCSCHLAGLSPSTSPPPLGEKPRQSRWTISHIDSHTMGDHIEGIPEPPSPIHVDDGDFTPTYDPSPDLAEIGPVIFEIGTLHDRPTHSRVDSPLTRYWYGMSEDAETHFEPAGTSYDSYAMPGFLHMIWHFMLNPDLSLTLCLGALSFITMRRGLGAQVTLHLPSPRWKLHHIFLLGLGLVILLGYEI